MACCLICFNDPVSEQEGNKYALNPNPWQITMAESPCKEPACFAASCLCPCCAQYYIRYKALDNDMSKYICCQGYFPPCLCIKPGHMGEQSSPELCLCLESFCCNCLAVSSTRLMVMDQFMLMSDEWDHRIIRFNNFVQALACICSLIAICYEPARDIAWWLRFIADIVYMLTQGCITAQVYHELNYRGIGLKKGQEIAVSNPGEALAPGAQPPAATGYAVEKI